MESTNNREALELIELCFKGDLTEVQQGRLLELIQQETFRQLFIEELAEQQLIGKLPLQQKAFFKDLISDPAFHEHKQFYQQLQQLISNEQPTDQTMAFFRKQEKQIKQRSRKKRRRIPVLASSVVLILFIGILGWANLFRYPPTIAQQEYQLPISTEDMGSPSSQTIIKAANDALRSGQYSKAAELLKEVSEPDDPFYYHAQYLKAHTAFKLEEYGEASKQFEWLIANIKLLPREYQIESVLQWYSVLAYLGDSQVEKAYPLMQQLKNTKYRAKIERLEKKLQWRFLVFR